jgi:peptidoglycan/xylan/chitin deacetylase (PgdA/CDA1 family)
VDGDQADRKKHKEEQPMSTPYHRDLIGYAGNPPDPKWPNGARLALNIVLNYEEGSEASMAEDGFTEKGLTEMPTSDVKERDLGAESMFEYGSRAGFWRILRIMQERNLPMTIFGCALALERHPPAAEAIRKAAFDVCCHGWRWIKHYELGEPRSASTSGGRSTRLRRPSERDRSAGTAATRRASTRGVCWSRRAASSTTRTPIATISPIGCGSPASRI